MTDRKLIALRRRVVDLQAVNEELGVLSELVEASTEGIGLVNSGGVILHANAACRELYGFEAAEEILGEDLFILAVNGAGQLEEALEQAMSGRPWRGQILQRRLDGTTFPAILSLFGIQGKAKRIEVAGFIIQEVSAPEAVELPGRARRPLQQQEQLRAAIEVEARLREEVVAARPRVVHESFPSVISTVEGIVVIPLVGAVDPGQVHHLTGVVLKEISRIRGRVVVILDITGVPVMDAAVVQALLEAAQSAQQMGAEAVLVGITPQVTEAIASLGLDLSGLVIRSDLRSGMEYALQRLGQNIAPSSDGHKEV